MTPVPPMNSTFMATVAWACHSESCVPPSCLAFRSARGSVQRISTRGGSRTRTASRPTEFESVASTNSATRAYANTSKYAILVVRLYASNSHPLTSCGNQQRTATLWVQNPVEVASKRDFQPNSAISTLQPMEFGKHAIVEAGRLFHAVL